jgi:repressor of nif and glnA expression
MKRFMKGIFAALVISGLVSISAFAGDKDKTEKKSVTITEDVTVNGTVLKPGEYQVKFDETSGELSILKDGKVKAKAPAHLQARTEKAKDTSLRTLDKGGVAELTGVTFGGWNQDVIVGSSGSMTGTQ